MAWLSVASAAQAQQAALPAVTFPDAAAISAANGLADQQKFAEAARQYAQWLNQDVGALFASEGGVVAVSEWPETLAPARRAVLVKVLAVDQEPEARGKLDAMLRGDGATFDALYALGRRYRFCAAGGEAVVAAAERALANGDLASASAAYQAAAQGGYRFEGATAERVELLRRIAEEGRTVALNPPATQPAAENVPSSIPNARVVAGGRSALGPWAGAMPFDATWIQPLVGAGVARFGLIGSEDRIVLSSPNVVAVFKEAGAGVWWNVNGAARATSRPAWTTPLPPPHTLPSAAGPFKVEGLRRPAFHQPAALFDVYGRAQVIVARQASGESSCLRAYRAADGKLMWSTEAAEGLAGVNFAGAPAVSGVYTYAVAVVEGGREEPTAIVLVAVDTVSGALRWKATVGTIAARGAVDGVFEQSEPAVAGDAVYVTPNAGVVACVGRIDGRVRWARGYVPAPVVSAPQRTREQVRQGVEAVRQYRLRKGEGPAPTLDPAVTERWRGTPAVCGGVVVTAPPDAADVMAYDAATGRALWHAPGDAEAPTLVGRSGAAAIFAGAGAVVAVDAGNGGTIWRWDGRAQKVAGPAVVREGVVVVPTVTVNVALNAADGSILRESVGAPTFRRALNGDVVRRLVEEAGAGASFGVVR